MKKILLGVIALLSFASVGLAQETYDFTSIFQVFECLPNTSPGDCNQIPDPYEIINFSVVLKDQNAKDSPKVFKGTWSEDRTRDNVQYNIQATVTKLVYGPAPKQTYYEVKTVIFSENQRKAKIAILTLHNMADFKGGFDNFADSYDRGNVTYLPHFAVAPKDWSFKSQLRKPILAEIIASE